LNPKDQVFLNTHFRVGSGIYIRLKKVGSWNLTENAAEMVM
jgi:hypothetical protein